MNQVIRSIGLAMVVLGFAGLAQAQDPTFNLTLDAPGSLTGAAGDPIQVEATGQLTTEGLSDTDDGAQGWSVSIAVSGGVLVDATTAGTDAAVADEGGFSFTEVIDPANNGGQEGAVSAVVLGLQKLVTLPPIGTADVIKLTVETTVPEPGEDDSGDPVCEPVEVNVAYVDGLVGSGEPVDNKITYGGLTELPTLGEATTVICPRIEKPLTFVTTVIDPESEVDEEAGEILIPTAGGDVVPVSAGIVLSSQLAVGDEICDNGEDDDGDELVDADDPDCAGAQGWSLSVATEACFGLTEATTSGTLLDAYEPLGFNVTGIVDPTKNAGQEGAVSAVVLGLVKKVELPAVGEHLILNLTGSLDGTAVTAPTDRGDPCNISTLPPVEGGGLIGEGEPVGTAVTVLGVTRKPAVVGADLVLVPVQEGFVRGNANNDDKVDIADPIWIINELFRGGAPTVCEDSADANDDGFVDLSDAVILIEYQFLGGPSPDLPFPNCGADPTEDDLGCGVLQPICSS